MNAFKKNNGHEPVANRRLILLVEDHPLNQKVALLLLERMGYDVHVANNGAEAVTAAKRQRYDAILMDCHMPEVDGFEATRQIRAFEETQELHVPIIAVTALAMAGDRERCLAAGMDDYLTKPIDRELLQQKLVYWMNPSAVCALKNPTKVIQIFDNAFALSGELIDEPLNVAQMFDAYGGEAPDLLLLFTHSSERIISDLKAAIEEEAATRVASLAHELKGASWAVGADEMARLSVFLEQAAGQENWRVIHRTYIRLNHHFHEVKRFIEAKLAGEPSSLQQLS